jgi:hypothetical protein
MAIQRYFCKFYLSSFIHAHLPPAFVRRAALDPLICRTDDDRRQRGTIEQSASQ